MRARLVLVCLVAASMAASLSAAGAEGSPPRRRLPLANGLAPAAAVEAMAVPPGFVVKLLAAEPDVCQPIAMCFDDRGRLWVAEAYSYPQRVAPEEARDRILIFEDTDGDDALDKRTVFKEGLNLVSGLEVGFGGVWVGAAPELLFIPDADGDDVPDGELRWTPVFGRLDKVELRGWEAPYQEQDDGREATSIWSGIQGEGGFGGRQG